ncbi:hypothetical protein QCA50_015320 [Cerrena zonata]|uniref:Uncharacterized protein n=1 Tax=Cerrena zonata TaxID=2478898 RepID=A0AAW0FQM6_9APHY
MISLTRVIVPLLAILSIAFANPIRRTGDPAINLPTAGTHIAPGANFSFSYNSLGDYGRSSYAYHVWLLADDAMGKAITPTTLFTNGYFFGRFDFANYPAVPYPKNPAPDHLTMPDFSQPEGGFGAGKAATNYQFQLVVIEEWDDGAGAVGRNLAISNTPIIYNATSSS